MFSSLFEKIVTDMTGAGDQMSQCDGDLKSMHEETFLVFSHVHVTHGTK
jgi:hypothetical protein